MTIRTDTPFLSIWLGDHPRALPALAESMPEEMERARAFYSSPRRDDFSEEDLFDGSVLCIALEGVLYPWEMAYLEARVRAAEASDRVRALLIKVTSPGGAAVGSTDFSNAVASFAKVKPVHAWCKGVCASAAYHIVAHAHEINATMDTWIGSIGTFVVVYDYSKMFEEGGVRVIVKKRGRYKAMLAIGTEVTQEQEAELDRIIGQLNDQFIEDVSTGRNLKGDKLAAAADGRAHVARDAIGLGLADDIVQTFDDALARVTNAINDSSGYRAAQIREEPMSDHKKDAARDPAPARETPTAATLKELKAALPGSTAEFREKCLEDECTMEQATRRWMQEMEKRQAELQQQLEAKDKALSEAQASAQEKPSAPPVPGNKQVGPGDVPEQKSEGDPIAEVEARVEKLRERNPSQARAMAHDYYRDVLAADPDLRERYREALVERNKQRAVAGSV